MWKFYRLWFFTAFWRAPSQADFWSGTAGAIFAAWAHFHPKGEEVMTYWGWQVPFIALGVVMLARLLLAPFRIWQEDQGKLARFAPAQYAYAISVVAIATAERRNGPYQVALTLRNNLQDQPLQVSDWSLSTPAGGRRPTDGLWNIPRNNNLAWRMEPIAVVDDPGRGRYPKRLVFSVIFSYGPPGVLLRRRRLDFSVEAPRGNALDVAFNYITDTEEDV